MYTIIYDRSLSSSKWRSVCVLHVLVEPSLLIWVTLSDGIRRTLKTVLLLLNASWGGIRFFFLRHYHRVLVSCRWREPIKTALLDSDSTRFWVITCPSNCRHKLFWRSTFVLVWTRSATACGLKTTSCSRSIWRSGSTFRRDSLEAIAGLRGSKSTCEVQATSWFKPLCFQ